LSEVEVEIARLTNELRTDPNGRLRRQGSVTNCGGRVPLNSDGGYKAAPALKIDELVSIEVARTWSAQMTIARFEHRPNAGWDVIAALRPDLRGVGENIAYHNYSDVAMRHFAGWRESEGHFCNMMDPGFTHLAVGEDTDANGVSFATQNFLRFRN
jgi:uncharacterized protein YkwD